MEKHYKKTIEVKKTIEIVIDEYNLACLISNAMADTCGFDWWGYDDNEYAETKKRAHRRDWTRVYCRRHPLHG